MNSNLTALSPGLLIDCFTGDSGIEFRRNSCFPSKRLPTIFESVFRTNSKAFPSATMEA